MKFSFYIPDSDYCDYLREKDPNVPYTMDEKSHRPFIGIVLQIDNYHYYAPLSSPKPKHSNMKNQLDFIKIEKGIYGVINLNNMIPIHPSCLTKVELYIPQEADKNEKAYHNLLNNQLDWCNKNQQKITRQAAKLYYMIMNGKAKDNLIHRCCDFRLDEKLYIDYCKIQQLAL